MGVVVALHVLAAVALVNIKSTTPIIQPLKVDTPIEIQLVASAEVAEAAPVKEFEPPSKPAVSTDIKSKPKNTLPIAKTSKPVAATKPVVKTPAKSEPKNIKPKPKTQADTPKVVKKEPFSQYVQQQESLLTAQADSLAASNDRKMLAAQAEKAAQEAHAKIMRDAQATADAKAVSDAQQLADAKAAQQAKAAKEASQAAAHAKADSDAKAAANAKALANAEAAAAASNTPINFNASNANWAAKPNFSFPDRAKRGAKSGDTFNVVLVLQVNKQGGIDSVRLAQSSGNAVLDREAQRQVRSGKFRPFMKNDVPVVGNVTLPISYAVP